jgi:hypothetical protein
MSETSTTDDDTARERPPPEDTPLRHVLASAATPLLTAVVERFWQDRGCRTARRTRGRRQFVMVYDADGDPLHLVWVDPEAAATPEHVERLERMAASFGDADATLASGRDYDAAVYTAADTHGVECLAGDQLLTLVERAGLQGVVRGHAESPASAVADGGAAAGSTVELQPPADHPAAVRAGLVAGGAAFALLALWGGAGSVTPQLRACGGDCPLLWAASFLPLLAALVGSFALVVGLFD